MSQPHGQGWFLASVCICLCVLMCVSMRLEEFILMICSDDCGDRPRPLPLIEELKDAIDLTERKGAPSWDYDVSGVVYYPAFLRFLDILGFFLHFLNYFSSLLSGY